MNNHFFMRLPCALHFSTTKLKGIHLRTPINLCNYSLFKLSVSNFNLTDFEFNKILINKN